MLGWGQRDLGLCIELASLTISHLETISLGAQLSAQKAGTEEEPEPVSGPSWRVKSSRPFLIQISGGGEGWSSIPSTPPHRSVCMFTVSCCRWEAKLLILHITRLSNSFRRHSENTEWKDRSCRVLCCSFPFQTHTTHTLGKQPPLAVP